MFPFFVERRRIQGTVIKIIFGAPLAQEHLPEVPLEVCGAQGYKACIHGEQPQAGKPFALLSLWQKSRTRWFLASSGDT